MSEGRESISGDTTQVSQASAAGGTFYTFPPGADTTLDISGTTMPTGTIVGFAPGDTIDLTSLAFAAGDSAILTPGNVLEVAEAGRVYDLNLDPNHNYTGDVFDIASDGDGGTDIAVRPATFVMNIDYDTSVTNLKTSNPTLYANFTNGVAIAVQYLESLFTNQVTVTLDIGYGEVDGQSLGSSTLGENEDTNDVSETYSATKAALIAQNAPGSSSLPATSPLKGSVSMSPAEAEALGLLANSGSLDGYAGFAGAGTNFSYALGVTPGANAYYFIGVVEHELTEEMGRVSELDQQPDGYSPIDLYRYTSAGARDLTTGRSGSTADFSVDGGATLLGSWNNNTRNGDLADWSPSGPAPNGDDSFNNESDSGVINVVGSVDDTLMQALGWEAATAANETPLPLRNDLAGNGVSDALMTNTGGALVVDEVSGGAVTYTQIGALGPEWQFEGTGPLVADGHDQFLLYYGADDSPSFGAVVVGEDVGGVAQYNEIGAIGAEWQFEGIGPFAGGGAADFLIWDTDSASANYGVVVVGADVNGVAQYTAIGGLGPEWQFEGTGDYLGDGKTGFMIWDTAQSSGSYGAVVVGEDVGGAAQYKSIGGLDPKAWVFEGSGDLLNDGQDSFLIWNRNNGALVVGEAVNGAAHYTQIGAVGSVWQFVGTGNYDGASAGEFLMRNSSSGALVIGTIAGGLASYAAVGGVGTEWSFHTANPALLA
ncbi:MAG TPA: NF038122 family metalloprotease [Stellaceae bacterium]|nr:NF038122 family metalloprotease [Stellaceae bacterium]